MLSVIFYAVGVTILLVSCWFLVKEKYKSALVGILLTSAFFLLDPEAFQGFLKTGVVHILNSYGKKINKLQDTLISQQKELDNQQDKIIQQQREIDSQHKDINKIQSDISNAQEEILKYQQVIERQQTVILEQQKNVEVTQDRLNDQQNKLENVELLVKSFFENIRTEFFSHIGKDRMLWSKDQFPGRKKGNITVFFELKKVPIPQTTQVQFHIYTQPPNSYFSIGNILVFIWGDSEEQLKKHGFSITYVADPTKKDIMADLSVIDGMIAMNGIPFKLTDEFPFSVSQ